MDEISYNKLGFIHITDIAKLIIKKSEFDELKELVVVSKYFNKIIYEVFPKLHKTLRILKEYTEIISTKNFRCFHSNIKVKQISRKIYEFIFRLLRKNEIILVNKIIQYIDKHKLYKYNNGMFYDLFHEIVSQHYTNEKTLLINLMSISPSNVDWKAPLECFEYWFEDLQIDTIILTILDLLKSAIIVNNENFIITLIKKYYEYDLYNWEENPKYIHLELVQLIESLEKSSTIYSDIVEYGKY